MQVYTEKEIASLSFEPEATFEDCEFVAIDFTDIVLKSVSFLDCKFSNCNLANQPLINTSMRDVLFETCNLVGINWCSLRRLENSKFVDSKLNYSTFQALKMKDVEIRGCSALEVDFSEADLSHADFSNSSFSGANFDRANLTGVDFRTSRDYLFDVRTARIKGAKFSFPDVISLLTALGAEVDI